MEKKILILLFLLMSINFQKSLGQDASKIFIDFSKVPPYISSKMGSLDKNPEQFSFAFKNDALNIVGLEDPKGIKIILNASSEEKDWIIIDEGLLKSKLRGTDDAFFQIEKSSDPNLSNFGEFKEDPLKGIPIKLPLDIKVTKENDTLAQFNIETEKKETITIPQSAKTNRFIFIPNLEDYKYLYAKAKLNESERKNIEKEIIQGGEEPRSQIIVKDKKLKLNRITYDFKDYHNLYSSKYSKLKAGINENVVFEVININPYTHTVVINNSIVNLHTEGAARFATYFQLPTTAAPTDVTKEVVNAQSNDSQKTNEQIIKEIVDKLNNFKTLHTELQEFYKSKIITTSPDIDLLAAEINFINENIIKVFQIPVPMTKEKLLSAGDKLTNEINDKKTKEEYSNIILESAEFYHQIIDINFRVTSGVIQPKNNDMLRFDLTIKRGEVDVMPTKEYEIMLKGGWKIDFSTGLFWNNLIDHEFTTKRLSLPDTTFFVDENFVTTDSITALGTTDKDSIMRNENGNFNIGIGILAHVYPRTGSRANYGLTGGFIVGTDSRIKYVIGGSVILGYEQRLIISGGMALGQVKRLGSGLNEGELLSPVAGQTSIVPTRDGVWNNGWFLGITWNLGSLNLSGKKSDQ